MSPVTRPRPRRRGRGGQDGQEPRVRIRTRELRALELSIQGWTQPQIAADPQGNAVALWERSNGTNEIIQGVGYDAAGPLLHALAIPATGTVGQPLSLSVSPLDVWSALGASSWRYTG